VLWINVRPRCGSSTVRADRPPCMTQRNLILDVLLHKGGGGTGQHIKEGLDQNMAPGTEHNIRKLLNMLSPPLWPEALKKWPRATGVGCVRGRRKTRVDQRKNPIAKSNQRKETPESKGARKANRIPTWAVRKINGGAQCKEAEGNCSRGTAYRLPWRKKTVLRSRKVKSKKNRRTGNWRQDGDGFGA